MKKVLSLLLCFIVVFSLAACGSTPSAPASSAPESSAAPASSAAPEQPQPAKEKNIYVIMKALGNQYWSILQAGAEKAGKDLGVNVIIVGIPNEADIEGQLRLLQDAVAAKADGIVIGVADSNSLAKPVSEAFQSGIPIILVDTMCNTEDYSAALLTNNVAAGEMAAAEMIKKLKAAGVSEDEVAEIAIQVGSTGSQTIIDRVKGFNTYWEANAPKKWVVLNNDIKNNEGDITKAVGFGQDFLTTYPNLKGMFGPNNGSTVGFVTALTEANRTDITMVGFDFSSEMENMIRSGKFNVSTLVQRQFFMGYGGVELAVKLSNGEKVTEKVVDTGVLVVDNKNIDTTEVQSVIKP